jgi:transketolase
VHVPTLKPIDVAGIVAAARKTGRVLTTEDHNIIGGLGSAVAEVLGQHHPVPMKIHGLQDRFGESGPNDAMLEKYGLTPKHIVAAARALLKAHPPVRKATPAKRRTSAREATPVKVRARSKKRPRPKRRSGR